MRTLLGSLLLLTLFLTGCFKTAFEGTWAFNHTKSVQLNPTMDKMGAQFGTAMFGMIMTVLEISGKNVQVWAPASQKPDAPLVKSKFNCVLDGAVMSCRANETLEVTLAINKGILTLKVEEEGKVPINIAYEALTSEQKKEFDKKVSK